MRVEFHIDESGTGSDEITIAGYLFESARMDEFCDKWASEIDAYSLPYFHMVDCAHGNGPFRYMTRQERIRLQMSLMKLIKKFSVNGIVCNIENEKSDLGRSYCKAVGEGVNVVIEWANSTAYDGSVAYFLESGACGQGLTDGWFNEVAKNPAKSAFYRYAEHAFVPKSGNPGVQAADFLSWQYHQFTKRRAQSSLARLDLRAILRHPHLVSDSCGLPPRESAVQSISDAKSRVETIHYLPKITKSDARGRSILKPLSDFGPIVAGDNTGLVFACPSCWRAVAEGVSFKQFRDIVLQCYCGSLCYVPRQMPPFATY